MRPSFWRQVAAASLLLGGCIKHPTHTGPVRFTDVSVACTSESPQVTASLVNGSDAPWTGSVVLVPDAFWAAASSPLQELKLDPGERRAVSFSVQPLTPTPRTWTGNLVLREQSATLQTVAASCPGRSMRLPPHGPGGLGSGPTVADGPPGNVRTVTRPDG